MAKKTDGDWLSWGLIVFLFIIGLSPLALLLLLVKLFGGDGKKKPAAETAPGGHSETEHTSRAKSAVKQMTRAPVKSRSSAKWLMIGGALLALAGLCACVEPIDMMVWLGHIESYYVEDLLLALAMAAGGGAMFFNGRAMSRGLKRYAKYLAVMGDRDHISVAELARTLGHSESRVEKDLQKMIDKGYFGGTAYLNVELGQLFRSGSADAAWRQRQEEQRKQETEEQTAATRKEYAAILANIRRANDDIDDPALSAQIDRIESITARIFSAVEADPRKEQKIATFLSYYLPTTQKLLDSYAEFESAGVEGEHLGQAKQRIEATMEKIIQGFERQLDELYQADAMDVDSDIRVMETMLRRDAASVADDFGTAAAQAQE